MNENRRHDPFVRELLAREDRVSEERYADYRRHLDRQLKDAARKPPRRCRRFGLRGRILLGAAAVASLVAVLAWHPWRRGPELAGRTGTAQRTVVLPEGGRAVVLSYPPQSRTVRDRQSAPYEEALTADFVATATVGEPFHHDNNYLVPLRLRRVLKESRQPRPDSAQPKPSFCCSLGEGVPAENTLPRGVKVMIYLGRNEAGDWSLLGLCPLDEKTEPPLVAGVERCLQVAGAARGNDPPGAYRRLLAPEAGGVDDAACTALTCKPDPRSADAVLTQLEQLRLRLVRDGFPAQGDQAAEVVAAFRRLVKVLASTHEARAVRPVLECSRHVPAGQRGEMFQNLPDLCKAADEATRGAVRERLVAVMEEADLPAPTATAANDYGPAAVALARLADARAFDVLVRQQTKRPITLTNANAVFALRIAAETLGGGAPERARAAWLELLRTHKPARQPTDAERNLIASVVGLLRLAGLTEGQKKVMGKIREKAQEAWFLRALEPLTK